MIFLGARQSRLAFLEAKHLLDFSVVLLNFPPHGTHLMRIVRRILSEIIGHDPVRAVGIHHDPEQFELDSPGNLNSLICLPWAMSQSLNCSVLTAL
jgi:hypothetical protein